MTGSARESGGQLTNKTSAGRLFTAARTMRGEKGLAMGTREGAASLDLRSPDLTNRDASPSLAHNGGNRMKTGLFRWNRANSWLAHDRTFFQLLAGSGGRLWMQWANAEKPLRPMVQCTSISAAERFDREDWEDADSNGGVVTREHRNRNRVVARPREQLSCTTLAVVSRFDGGAIAVSRPRAGQVWLETKLARLAGRPATADARCDDSCMAAGCATRCWRR